MQDDWSDLVYGVRKGLEETAARSAYTDSFRKFPVNCCFNASMLLSVLLWKRHQLSTYYHLGIWEDGGEVWTHGWITCDGLIVDITADQFDDVDHPVIIAATSSWHKSWPVEQAPSQRGPQVVDMVDDAVAGALVRDTLALIDGYLP